MNEISSLQIDNQNFYGINDSGGDAKLFKINSNGQIIQTIEILNATNIDWESITFSETKIFLADTGNNQGNRTNLSIYSIPKSTRSALSDEINFQIIYISIENKFIQKLNGSKGGYFSQNSCFKSLKSFSIISSNHKLVA